MSALDLDLTIGAQKPGKLQRLWVSPSTHRDDISINIVIVPEVGAPLGKSFAQSSWNWLGHLSVSLAIKFQIFIFEYTLEKTGVPVWQSLVQRGSELVKSLLEEQDASGIFERSMIFVCHGLGGLVVKRALSFPYGQDYNPLFRRLLDVHSGIVFLGTPHLTYARRKNWPTLSLILRSSSNVSKMSLVQAEMEAAIIANASLTFEEAGIEVPVLSAYETKATKINEGMFRSRKLVLVTKTVAETCLKYEKMIAVDKSHREMCVVDVGSPLFQEIVSMIQSIVARPAPRRTTLGSLADSIPPDDMMWASTAPDLENQKVVEDSDFKMRSKEAAFGSTETSSFVMIPTLNNFIQPKPAPKLPCYLMGPETPNRDFLGRQEVLFQIKKALIISPANQEKLSVRDPGPRSFALCGLGGVGKSQVAVEFVHLHKEDYDAIFWVQADNDNSIAESFGQIAAELKLLNPSERNDSVINRNVVMEWLSNSVREEPLNTEDETSVLPSVAKWLIVFDNADDLEVLRDYWPATGNGAILVTSRDPMAKTYSTANAGMDLEPLSPEEASALMMKLAGYEATLESKEQSYILATRLGGLPLAITQIAAIIRSRDLTFKEFLDIFEEEYSKRELLLGQDQYNHTLSTIWGLENVSPSARGLLDVLSLLDPDCIHESLFTNHLPQEPKTDFPSTSLLYIEARKSLIKSSLIKRNKNQGQLLLHRLIQDVTRAHMSPEKLKMAFELTVNILSQSWPEASYIFSHETFVWGKADQVVPHVLRIADIHDKNPKWNIDIDVQRDLAELLQKGGWHVAEKGNFRVAERMFSSSLKICGEQAEAMPEQYANALFCSGSYASDTNQFRLHLELAQKHFDQRMKIESQKSALTLGTGRAHSELGLAYLLNNQYDKAIEHSIIARRSNEKLPEYLNGSYWPFFAIIHHAQALLGLNREAEALDMLLETLRWREVKYGPNDTESFKLGYTLQVLGTIRAKQGNHKESLDLFQRALINYKDTIGLNHHRTGHVLVKLAEEHARLGHLETANIFFDQALKIFGSHSAYNPESARTTFKKAQFHEAIGNDAESKNLFSRAKFLYSEVVPSYTSLGTPLAPADFDAIVAIWAR